jgi:small GTP-binding protein
MNPIKRTKFNISLLGDTQVGKSSMVEVLTGNPFQETRVSTIGIENVLQSAVFDGKKYLFKIFDTAGQERFESISSQTIKIADGFLLVFSVDKKVTFERIEKWIESIKSNVDITKKVLILCGNKIDIEEREVSNEEAMKYASEKNIKCFETSAKTGFGIKEVFEQLYSDIYELSKSLEKSSSNEKAGETLDEKKLNKKPKNNRTCC